MKLRTIGLAATLLLQGVQPTTPYRAELQTVPLLYQQPVFDMDQFYQKQKLQLTDIVDALSEYDVKHQELPYPNGFVYGLSNHQLKRVWLNTEQNSRDMKGTVIHEMYHIKLYKQGIQAPDEVVGELERRTMEEYYDTK